MGAGSSKPTLEEQMRESKRMINRAVRELDRENSKMHNQETKLVNDLKAAARKGQLAVVNTLAKDLVRVRKYQQKFTVMKSHLQGVGLKMQAAKSTEVMGRSLASSTKAMTAITQKLNVPALDKVLAEFQAQSEKLGLISDQMGETIDSALDDIGDSDEKDEVVAQVLEEIGIDFNEFMSKAGNSSAAATGIQAPTSMQTNAASKGFEQQEPVALAEGAVPSSKGVNTITGPSLNPQAQTKTGQGPTTLASLEARLNALKSK